MDNTTDLSKFGYRELDMAGELLTAIKNGLPDDFEADGITVMFNPNSGNVFLTNSEYQVAMLVGGKLESFYSCAQCGNEGFDKSVGESEGYEFVKHNGFCSKECEDKN